MRALTAALILFLVPVTTHPGGERLAKTTPAAVVVVYFADTSPSAGKSCGAAFVVDKRGYMITVRHVVGAAKEVPVQLHDGKKYKAAVVASSSEQDLAVLKITHAGLTILPLAEAAPEVGSTVYAVGHPRGHLWSFSRGIVSAVGRSIEMPNGHTLRDLIQTDAAINPGNSGGPLLDVNGNVVAIVVATRTDSNSIAYAISAAAVRKFISLQVPID